LSYTRDSAKFPMAPVEVKPCNPYGGDLPPFPGWS